MKAIVWSHRVDRVAKALLFVFAVGPAGVFFSACTGPAYRHERRVDRRGDRWERRDDRQDYRVDRRYDRMDRRYERWD